jgi:hypothetical protein
MKHTKGPWRLIKHTDPAMFGMPATNMNTIFSHDSCVISDHVMRVEDAHLIAAAPEMLEALEAVTRCFLGGSDVLTVEMLTQITTAISKAKGGAV